MTLNKEQLKALDDILTTDREKPNQAVSLQLREIAEKIGASPATVMHYLDNRKDLKKKGRKWLYRHNQTREE